MGRIYCAQQKEEKKNIIRQFLLWYERYVVMQLYACSDPTLFAFSSFSIFNIPSTTRVPIQNYCMSNVSMVHFMPRNRSAQVFKSFIICWNMNIEYLCCIHIIKIDNIKCSFWKLFCGKSVRVKFLLFVFAVNSNTFRNFHITFIFLLMNWSINNLDFGIENKTSWTNGRVSERRREY